MQDYISLIPQELLGDIRRGECLPVIGAGFSRDALLPPGCSMPLWDDLGRVVAEKLGRTCGTPVEALSEYCQKCGKFELIRILRERLHIRTAKPGPVHSAFASLPFRQVLTTNFDFLIEKGYESCGKSYLPVVDEDLLPFGLPDGETRVIKMHGDLHHPSNLVITEDDYDRFFNLHHEMAMTVLNLMVAHTLVFIGYSASDPDFRQMWGMVKNHFGELHRPAYAIVVDPPSGAADIYQRRGVTRILSLPGSAQDYGSILSALFRQVADALRNM